MIFARPAGETDEIGVVTTYLEKGPGKKTVAFFLPLSYNRA